MSGRSGWAWGHTEGGDWLTILGSAHRLPVLAPTADEAVRPEVVVQGREWELAKVREVEHPGVTGQFGIAYRIVERAAGSK